MKLLNLTTVCCSEGIRTHNLQFQRLTRYSLLYRTITTLWGIVDLNHILQLSMFDVLTLRCNYSSSPHLTGKIENSLISFKLIPHFISIFSMNFRNWKGIRTLDILILQISPFNHSGTQFYKD